MLKQIANIHKLCFPNKPWSENDFAELKKSGCEIMSSDNGFIVWRTICDETELITIGVAPNARGTGIADAMLTIMEQDLIGKIFLEVSENNTPAINLYKKHGYIAVGRRPEYYDGVDAIVMRKQIPERVYQK